MELRKLCKDEESNDSTGASTDYEFEPTAEMLVHDYDDERTLDEEEGVDGVDDPQTEISALQREQEMPLDQLLAMYGYDREAEVPDQATQSSSASDEILSNQDLTLDKDEIARDLLGEPPLEKHHSPRLLRSFSRVQSDDEDEQPSDLHAIEDNEEWKKKVPMGEAHQAVVPESLSKYGDTLPYENDDKLLWNSENLDNDVVENYLRQVKQIHNNNKIPSATRPQIVQDDEEALFTLLQCGYNTDEALRRERMTSFRPMDVMSLWSDEECLRFEEGLRTHGKDFYLIQQNQVRTRNVGELVTFYYFWKKSERHDMFVSKSRLEKKKYNYHPGTTDYMDRFLDEQNNPRDRSSSPVHSLISGDPKRQSRSSPCRQSDEPNKHLDKDNLEIKPEDETPVVNSPPISTPTSSQ